MIKFLEEQLVSFKTKKYYSWDYELETDKIIELIQMNNKDVYSFIFDKGTKATNIFKRKFNKNEYVESVREDESKELVMLKFVDWIATFFGKLLRSYANSFKMDTKSEKELALNTVADLERTWFDISENQFELIKLIGGMITNKKILFLQGSLADNSRGLSNYFEYISEYENYEEFRKVDLYKHEQKNNFRLNFLWEKFYFKNNILFDTKYTTDGVTTEYVRNRRY